MKSAAIICELNPLHSGHKKLIDYARSVADNVICIMSGNFTQRGMPACADKYARAKHAILAGADMVVELPTVFATASAENFAYGAIQIVNAIQADAVIFGSECGDIVQLQQCAELLRSECVNEQIKKQIALGVSYPRAVYQATKCDLLNGANNVLAIEYLQAMQRSHSTATPLTVKRENDRNATTAGQFASSALLRDNKALLPLYSYDYVICDIDDAIEQKYRDFAALYISVADKDYLARIEGVTEGLENRIVCADKSHGYDVMLDTIKTKRYTRLKLQRIILNAILKITEKTVSEYKSAPLAVNALAVSDKSLGLLSLTRGTPDPITLRADSLYCALAGKNVANKLLKIHKN